MRAVLIATMLVTGLLVAAGGALGQTNTPAPLNDVRRPYLLVGGGQRVGVLVHTWGSTYVPGRPEEIPTLAAPEVPQPGIHPWDKNVQAPRTWPIISVQYPCRKC